MSDTKISSIIAADFTHQNFSQTSFDILDILVTSHWPDQEIECEVIREMSLDHFPIKFSIDLQPTAKVLTAFSKESDLNWHKFKTHLTSTASPQMDNPQEIAYQTTLQALSKKLKSSKTNPSMQKPYQANHQFYQNQK